ncbi:putative GPI transamidase component PIG-U [Eremomyces bilateralis CBS 781.70]|uniref:GPI transamidase component PIG-U n=1 Tax=Eremomyces bilateralis CBS 781.70 TaxID=1392243 RepID=A0A6G1FXQ1_9PEZI|nr:putative GPI transamidase component PIG-U [Eremomyces bilateralis CBS 781.70]KAF1810461.1 putative GPI transamidase component PIG-U [Eremomyces bilateralis CBS 781.70]
MGVDKQTVLLFAAAAAVRLFLFIAFPSLPDLLTGRVEVSTPITSFKRLQEGLFLYTHNVSPYDGGVFHQAPLLLPIFALLPNVSTHPLPTAIVYIALDLLGAYALVRTAESGESVTSRLYTSPRKHLSWSSAAIGASFLLNPFTIVTCLARSTSAFTNCAILFAIFKATAGHSFHLVLSLAVASYTSLYPILLAPPLLILCYDRQVRQAAAKPTVPSPVTFAIQHTGGLVAAIGCLLCISYMLTGSWEFIGSTYGFHLLLPDLTPNVGLWWYFFTEMFDSFREFFLAVFWLHMASYVGGLTLRLREQPLFAIVALLGIFAIFLPYPSVSETAVFVGCLSLYSHVFPLMRYAFLSSTVLLYATFFGPAFYHLWIYAGSGNANFFYAITLVWSLALIMILGDSLFAVLRDEWEAERPDMVGKEVRQI